MSESSNASASRTFGSEAPASTSKPEKRVLIITRPFPPSSVIGTQRPLRIARGIGRFGWTPYVLTAADKCQVPPDLETINDIPAGLRIAKVRCLSIEAHTNQWRQFSPGWRRAVGLAGRVVQKLFTPFNRLENEVYLWMYIATGRGVRFVRENKIDLIWATTPLGVLGLGYRISQRTGVPLVVDYRDVIYEPRGENATRRERWRDAYEKKVLAHAVGLTYAAPAHRRVLLNRYPEAAALPHRLIHSFFEAGEISTCPTTPRDRPTLVHGGSLYGGHRDMSGLFQCLAELAARRDPIVGDLRFRQYCEADGPYLSRLARQCDVENLIEVLPRQPRREFLSICRGASILLLSVGRNIDHAEHAGAIPGKLYDYLAAARPILVLGPPDCEAGQLVERVKRGIHARDNDPAEIAAALRNLLAERGRDGALDLSPAAVAEFESEHALAKLAQFLNLLSTPANSA